MRDIETVDTILGPLGTAKSALMRRSRWERFKAWLVGLVDGTTTSRFFTLPLSEGPAPEDLFGPTPPYDPRPVAKRNLEDVRKRFAGDITDHVMEVHHEDGLYRHLRFRKPGTMMYHFDLITWPGYLSIQGDMGCYTFSRTTDMFQFFRSGKDINPHYWGEKLQNGGESGTRSVRKFNVDLVEEHLKDAYDEWVADNETTAEDLRLGHADQDDMDRWLAEAAEVWERMQEVMWGIETEQDAHEALSRFEQGEVNRKHRLVYDVWEWGLTDFDYHFLWCCFAIQWGVRKYDEENAACICGGRLERTRSGPAHWTTCPRYYSKDDPRYLARKEQA